MQGCAEQLARHGYSRSVLAQFRALEPLPVTGESLSQNACDAGSHEGNVAGGSETQRRVRRDCQGCELPLRFRSGSTVGAESIRDSNQIVVLHCPTRKPPACRRRLIRFARREPFGRNPEPDSAPEANTPRDEQDEEVHDRNS